MPKTMRPFYRFTLYLVIFSSLIYGLTEWCIYQNWLLLPRPDTLLSILFYSLLTLLVFYLALYSQKQQDSKLAFMLLLSSIGIRFLLALSYLVAYIVITGKREALFLFTFVSLYILYTVFEIVLLRSKLRPDFEPNAKTDEAR